MYNIAKVMKMLVPIIILFSVYFLFLLGGFIFIKKNQIDKSQYEVVTGYQKGLLIFGLVFTIIGALLHILGLVLILIDPNEENFILCPIMGSMFGYLGFALVVLITSQFEAIKGNNIYIRRFIKIKEIPISDIASFNFLPNMGFMAQDKYGKKLFTIGMGTKGFDVFFNLLKQRKEERIFSNVDELDALMNQEEERETNTTLAAIGKEYRDSYSSRKKKTLIGSIIGWGIVIVLAFLFFLFLIKRNDSRAIMIFFALVVLIIMSIVITQRLLTNQKKELDKDDEWLGAKHKMENKHVVGYHKNKARAISLLFIGPMIIGSISLLILPLTYASKPVKQEDLVEVSGQVEYMKEIGDDDIVLAFKDNPIEYRLDGVYTKYFDYSVFKEVSKGTTMYIQTDNAKTISLNQKRTDRKEYKKFYTLKTDTKEYLSYDNYLKADQYNTNFGKVMGYICLGIGLTSILAFVIVKQTYGKSVKGEYINV